jgi:hypothetical protein
MFKAHTTISVSLDLIVTLDLTFMKDYDIDTRELLLVLTKLQLPIDTERAIVVNTDRRKRPVHLV